MILIADSGSTKTHWEIIHPQNNDHASLYTAGINPFYQSEDEIKGIIEAGLLSRLNSKKPEKVLFYGAGCSQPDKKAKVAGAIQFLFKNAAVSIEHDLLGAARATCGNKPGITAILGTGSNSCLFDGKEILDNIPSLGFILGDEGSGAYLGRKLLQAYFYRELPEDLMASLEKNYKTEKSAVLNQVYDKPQPNQFIATYAKFFTDNNEHPFIIQLLENGFKEFLERQIIKYKGHQQLPVHFIGSVAFHNQNILKKVMADFQLQAGTILKSPMDGLLQYHLNDVA